MFLVQQISQLSVHLQSVVISVINISVVKMFLVNSFNTQKPRQSWLLAFIAPPLFTSKNLSL